MKMKNHFQPVVLLAALLSVILSHSALGQYNQATVSAFATGANVIETDATTNSAASFRTNVANAWTNGTGGVMNFPTAISLGTTLFRGTYGNGKRLHITSSAIMQNITSGTFTVLSTPNGTTTATAAPASAHQDYTLTFALFSTNTDLPLIDETVKQVGLPILSRTAAGYPLDLRVTCTFSDGSTQAVTSAIASGAGVDDTFFWFVAPDGAGINSLRLQSFSPGTSTPIADRIGWDDCGFISGPATVTPQPQIVNLSPLPYFIVDATNGIHFDALTYVSIPTNNISLVVNSNDVSSQLIFTGDPTNYSVSYFGLVPGQEYQITIGVTNSGGVAILDRIFYTITNGMVLYDSEGFTNDTIYPLGPLQTVTHGRATWLPNAVEPAQIVDAGPPQNKALERPASGLSRADFLGFPPFASGRIIMEFDAFISTTLGRTIDICLQPTTGGNTMASFIAWGEPAGKLSYFNNVNWVPLADLQTAWHHVVITNYLSGIAGGKYDVFVDGAPVAQKISWRNATVGSAFNQFRIQTQDTAALLEYGRIDNLMITAAPEDPNTVLPPQIVGLNVSTNQIISTSSNLQFAVTSALPIDATNITVLLNSNDISGSLVVTGSPTNLSVSYGPLANGNYTVEIHASSSAGSTVLTPLQFIASDESWMLHPADGWASPWQWTSGFPELLTANPIDGSTPYLDLNTTSATRNFMRQYQSGSVDITQPHFIRWKFRMLDPNFDVTYTNADDRVHFFAHPVSRITASTTTGNSWAIFASGGVNMGVTTNQAFYIFDNADGTGAFNPANHVNSGILVRHDHIYAFEILVRPVTKDYFVKIADQTDSLSFASTAPHKFRDLTDATHTFLHFGGQASPATDVRAYEIDSVSVSQATIPVTLTNPGHNGANFSFSFQSQAGATHTARFKSDILSGIWTDLITIAGDGGMKTVTHTNAPAGPLFYQVKTDRP
jgi:hypothetical protein